MDKAPAAGAIVGCSWVWSRGVRATMMLVALAVACTVELIGQRAGKSTLLAGKLHEAVMAAQRGDANKALQLTQALIAEDAAYAPAWKLQGALLEAMGRNQEAEASFEQTLKLTPDDAEVLFKVGVADLVRGDSAGAVERLEREVKKTPRDADALFYLAQAYHLQGKNDPALKAIGKSLAVAPANPAVRQKYGELLCSAGNNQAALEQLLQARKADPTLERIDFDLGVATFRNEDLDNALQYATRAAAARPNDMRALALLAEVDVKLARWPDAKPVFERLLAEKKDDPASLLGLAHCELALKNYQASADILESLVRQDPTTILAHFYLARAYAGMGRKEEAAHEAELHSKLVEQAPSLVPRDEREMEKTTLLAARQMLDEGHEAEAITLFRIRAKGPAATVGAPYMLTGVVYLYMGRSDDAERLLRKALTIEPAVREAHTYLGLLALQQRDLEGAEGEFLAELARQPNSQLAVAEIGEIRYRQGRWAEAAEQLARSRTVSPALLYMLSDAYFHLGEVKDADLTAEVAAGYAKNDPEGVRRIVELLRTNQQTQLAERLGRQ